MLRTAPRSLILEYALITKHFKSDIRRVILSPLWCPSLRSELRELLPSRRLRRRL